jgi:hypothetical protein
MKDYHINVFYSEDDEGYIADIPDLQSYSAFGDTRRGLARGSESQAGLAGGRSRQ